MHFTTLCKEKVKILENKFPTYEKKSYFFVSQKCLGFSFLDIYFVQF